MSSNKTRRRRSVSVRDGEYMALKLYTEHIDQERSGIFTMTGVLKMVLFGELPPIPQSFLDAGVVKAELEREERAKNPPPSKEEVAIDFREGGNIFTF